MNLEIELADARAVIRTSGYVNRDGSERIARLANALSDRGVRNVQLDLSGSPLINASAMERLIDTKYRLALRNISLLFTGLTPTLAKILRIMGLDPRSQESLRAFDAVRAPGGFRGTDS